MLIANAMQPEQPACDGGRKTAARFTATEVIANFQALYDTLDFKSELHEMGIGPLQLKRRRKALREIRALCIAFWGLALEKSFPDDAERFFIRYLEVSPELTAKGNAAAQLRNRVAVYVDLLREKKDTDFLPVASYLAEILSLSAEDTARLRLKLSLMMRSLYMLIFDKLV